MFALFGQVVSSEILMASESGCPIEYHAIKIEKCDPMFDRNCKGGRTMPVSAHYSFAVLIIFIEKIVENTLKN